MPESSIVFSGKLPNGLEYKIHTQQGFVKTQCQIAVEVAGEVITVCSFTQKRGGNIEVVPSHNGKITLHTNEPIESVKPVDLLSGIINQ